MGRQIEHLTHASDVYDRQSTELSIAVDAGYTVLDSVDAYLVLTGAEGSPLLLGATLALTLVDQFAQAGIKLEKLENQIRLSSTEKFDEFLNFFLGADRDEYLTLDINAKNSYKSFAQRLVNTYLEGGTQSILVATLDDIEIIKYKRIPHPSLADKVGAALVAWSDDTPPCLYQVYKTTSNVILKPEQPSVVEFNASPPHTLSRIAAAPSGTQFLCVPSSDDVHSSEFMYIHYHPHGRDKCREGHTVDLSERVHWPSSRISGQPFCQNAFVLKNTTSSGNGLYTF